MDREGIASSKEVGGRASDVCLLNWVLLSKWSGSTSGRRICEGVVGQNTGTREELGPHRIENSSRVKSSKG